MDAAPSFWRSPGGAALLVAAAVGGFFLAAEHRAHLLGALPFLFVLACPLMHFVMHRGHDGHAPRGEREGERK